MHACGGSVFSVRLVIFGVARLVLSCLLLLSSAPLFLPLSASASGKTDTLIAEIWGGHLAHQASSLCFSLMGLGLYAVGLCLVKAVSVVPSCCDRVGTSWAICRRYVVSSILCLLSLAPRESWVIRCRLLSAAICV